MVEHRSLGTRSHSSECRARFKVIWTKELAEAEVPIRAEAEVAKRAVDAVPIDPNGRVSEPLEPAAAAGGQHAAVEVNTDPVVERAGGLATQPDVSQAQPMEVSLEQRATTGSTKRTAETQVTPNSVESASSVQKTTSRELQTDFLRHFLLKSLAALHNVLGLDCALKVHNALRLA